MIAASAAITTSVLLRYQFTAGGEQQWLSSRASGSRWSWAYFPRQCSLQKKCSCPSRTSLRALFSSTFIPQIGSTAITNSFDDYFEAGAGAVDLAPQPPEQPHPPLFFAIP